MSLVTLSEVKLHCRIDNDEEDSLLNSYIAAADLYITNYCGQNFEELGTGVPMTIKCAALMVVAGLYENREMVSEGRYSFHLNPILESCLEQYRVNRGVR